MAKFVDVTLRLIDEMTQPMKSAVATFEAQSKQMIRTGKQIQRNGQAIANTGKAMTMAITVPAVALGTAAVKNYAAFDENMTLVNATMNNTKEESKILTDAIRSAASNSIYSMTDAGEAALSMARGGLTAAEAADAIAPAMNAAAGEGGDLDIVTNGLISTIRAFNDEFSNAEKYTDVFAAACNNSQLDINELSEAMSVAAPIFNAAGYGIEDAALYMGIMANSGIEASVAANSLKTGLAKLVSPAKEGAEWLDKLGVEVANADGSMKDSMTIYSDLHNAFANLSESEQMAAASAIFGKNQMAPWLALINTGTEDVNELYDSIANSKGLSQQMADNMMGGFAGSLKALSSNWDVFMNTLGEKLAPYVKNIADILLKFTNKLNSMSDEQFDALIKVVAALATLGPALLVIGKTVIGIGKLVQAIGTIGKALSAAKSAGSFITMLIGPGGWIALVIIAIIALAVIIYKNWDKIKPVLVAIWEKTKEVFIAIANFLVETFTAIGQFFVTVWDGIKQTFTSVVDFIKSIFIARITAYVSIVVNVFNSLKDSFTAIFDGVKQIFSGIIDFITGVFTGNWKKAWEGVKEIFGGIFNSFAALVKTPINAVIAIINGAIAGINKINVKVPDWVPGLGGKNFGFNIPEIPALAVGTDNWTGGLAQINERGGEIVDLPSGSRVYPHDESVQKAYIDGARSNGNITISIPKIADSVVIREDADIDKLVNKLANQLTQAASSLGTSSMSSMGRATGTLAATGTM